MLITDLQQWLRPYLLPTSLTEARTFLTRLNAVVDAIQCYQHFFPAECERSLESIATQELLPLPGDAYSIPEQHFLQLVHTHLFPLPEWVFFDACEENRCDQVPFEARGLASLYEYSCIEEGAEGMDLGWQLVLYLLGRLEHSFFLELLDENDPAHNVFEQLVLVGQVDAQILETRCEHCPEPLRFFSLALDVLDLDTGNPWLDTTGDMPVHVPWEPAAVAQLAEQWRASQAIWEKAMRFIQWIEADVPHHFTEVIQLWNQCRHDSDARAKEAPAV